MNSMQHEFNEVCKHLIKQGKRASKYERYGGCKYRTEDGLSCAVGCRIPDYMYDPEFEDRNVGELISRYKEMIPSELIEYEHMFSALQYVHDDPKSWITTKILKLRLREVAKSFDLEIPDIIKEDSNEQESCTL